MHPDQARQLADEDKLLVLDEDDPFESIVLELVELRRRKGHDYGDDKDTFSNITQSEDFGVDGWLGAAIRLNDKVNRIKSFAKKGSLKNEPIEDAFKDIAVYAIIALVLYRRK